MTDLSKIIQSIGKMPNLNLELAQHIPKIQIPPMPTVKEQHEYESSGALIGGLSRMIKLWRKQLPENVQPVTLAILANGTTIRVSRLIQQGHNGIIIEGSVNDSQCMVMVHQAALQLLCYVEQIQEHEKKSTTIGFHYNGQQADEGNQQQDMCNSE